MDEEEGEEVEEEVEEAVGDPEVAAGVAAEVAADHLQEVLPEVGQVIPNNNGAAVDLNTVSPELPLEEEDLSIPR